MRVIKPTYRLFSMPSSGPRLERCRLVGTGKGLAGPTVLLEIDGESFAADLSNPETLHGDIPAGAEITVALSGLGGRKAELLLTEADRLPPGLCEELEKVGYAPPGLLRDTGHGWRYLCLFMDEEADLCVAGPVELSGPNGYLLPPDREWRVRKRLLDRLPGFVRPARLDLPYWSWKKVPVVISGGTVATEDAQSVGNAVERHRELRAEDLEEGRFEELARDLSRERYWAEPFEPDFYRAQARAGFIATAFDRGDRSFLLPRLHSNIAILDWPDLHRSRSLDRLFRSGRLETLGARLVVNEDPACVLGELYSHWKWNTWLVPAYLRLMLELAAGPRPDFRVFGIELRVEGETRPVAGELGYAIGRTYTSLSGFHRLDRAEWNDLGKVQLHLLAARLRDSGFAFWNLGSPAMQYKTDMGARILPREEYLGRWRRAVKEETPLP